LGKTSFVDISGMKFGEWSVIRYLGSQYWECECSCGVVRNVLGKTLRNGKSQSCGHTANKFKDISGKIFNNWKVIEYIGDNKWKCICSCGNTGVVQGLDLRSGKSKDCGHSRYNKLSMRNSEGRHNLEGKVFGHWTVLSYEGNKSYMCRCSCGVTRVVMSAGLLGGTSTSCGHTNGEKLIIDIRGKQIGKLKVLKYIGHKKWVCKCDCGRTVDVEGKTLRDGKKTCCGCSVEKRGVTQEMLAKAIDNSARLGGKLPTAQVIAKKGGWHPATVIRNARRFGLEDRISIDTKNSLPEFEIKEMFPTRRHGDRWILKGSELDLYYEDSMIAVEYNGNYWHREEYRGKLYHLDKTMRCAKIGVQLIHIFEYEWLNKRDRERVISLLKREIDGVAEVESEAVKIEDVVREDADDFIDKYSFRRIKKYDIAIGCYLGGELVGEMLLKHTVEKRYELLGVVWKDGLSVRDGERVLFDDFKNKVDPDYVVCRVDIAKFTGNELIPLGFKIAENGVEEPRYVWTKTSSGRYVRDTADVARFIEKLGSKGKSLEECRIFRVYDAGYLKMEWHKNTEST